MDELEAGFELAGYRVASVAGRGGMGVVYRATDVALDRPVALKLITGDLAGDPDFRARFQRESRIAASIRHPNVITVFRAGEEDGLLYIAMDYVQGTDLKELIVREGRIEPVTAAAIVAQVAAALDAAHAKALVHRDVKPANVLIADEDGRPHAYLTDFGLSKGMASESAMTKTGTFVGTLDYVAPEQVRGDRVDARTDVYSLGCVLYHCMTGTLPYPKESDVAKLYAHAHEPQPSARAVVPELPAECDDVLSRAMAKDPADRFQSAGDLGRAAEAAVAGRAASGADRTVAVGAAAPLDDDRTAVRQPTATAQAAHPAAKRRRRRPLLAGAGLVVLIAAIAVALASGGGGSGDNEPKSLTKDQYEDQVLDAARPYIAQTARTGELPDHIDDPESAVDAADKLSSIRKTLDTTIADVERIRPPDDVKDLHARTLKILRSTRRDLAAAGAAADFGNDADYRAALRRAQEGSGQLDAMAPEFRARGYPRLGQPPG